MYSGKRTSKRDDYEGEKWHNNFDSFFVRESNLKRYWDFHYFGLPLSLPRPRLSPEFSAPPPYYYYPESRSFQPGMHTQTHRNLAQAGSRPWQASHHRTVPRRKNHLDDGYFAKREDEGYGSRAEDKSSRYASTRTPVRIDIKRQQLDDFSKEKCADKLNKCEAKTVIKSNTKDKETVSDLAKPVSVKSAFKPVKEAGKAVTKRRSSYQGEPNTKHRKMTLREGKAQETKKKGAGNSKKPIEEVEEYDIIKELERTIDTLSKKDKDLVQEESLAPCCAEVKKDIKMKLINSPSNKDSCTLSKSAATGKCTNNNNLKKSNVKNKFPFYANEQQKNNNTDKPILEEIFILEDALKDIDGGDDDGDKEAADCVENSGASGPKMGQTEDFDDFLNLDTRKSYLYPFTKLFDDNRTVDMDICNTPSPSVAFDGEKLEIGACEAILSEDASKNKGEATKNDFPDKKELNINLELLKIFGDYASEDEQADVCNLGSKCRSKSLSCLIPDGGTINTKPLRKVKSLNDICGVDSRALGPKSSDVNKDELLSLLLSDDEPSESTQKIVANDSDKKKRTRSLDNYEDEPPKPGDKVKKKREPSSKAVQHMKHGNNRNGCSANAPKPASKEKYITKAQYVKTFGRIKSPVDIALSIETNALASRVKQRRATFTCDTDNETILKKVDKQRTRQTFLELFGPSSDEEEEEELDVKTKGKPLKTTSKPEGKNTKEEKVQKERRKSRSSSSSTDSKTKEKRRHRRSRSKSKEKLVGDQRKVAECRRQSTSSNDSSKTKRGSCKKDKINKATVVQKQNVSKSVADITNGSSASETSLTIDESSLLMNRASDMDVDVITFEGCRPYTITSPQLRKIAPIETVQDECVDKVCILDPPDVRQDCATVFCAKEDDDVVEVTQPTPLVDLTQENASQEDLAVLLLDTKTEIGGTITLYRAEEGAGDQAAVSALGAVKDEFNGVKKEAKTAQIEEPNPEVTTQNPNNDGAPTAATIVSTELNAIPLNQNHVSQVPSAQNVANTLTDRENLAPMALNVTATVSAINTPSVQPTNGQIFAPCAHQNSRPPTLVNARPEEGAVVDLTNENQDLSNMDLKILVEIFTRHIYFLAHLCNAQKAYVESLHQRPFYNYYFKTEIALFEQEKRSRLFRQSARLCSELQYLGVGASRNVSAVAALIVDHVTVNLKYKDMPKPVTKSIVYLLLGELMKPQAEALSAVPLFKTLMRHCDIVASRMQTRSAGGFTEEMRRTLASQVQEYIRLFGQSPLVPNHTNQPCSQFNANHVTRPPPPYNNYSGGHHVLPERSDAAATLRQFIIRPYTGTTTSSDAPRTNTSVRPQRSDKGQNPHVFARPRIAAIGRPNSQIADLPGGPNTNTLGLTPRYLPTDDASPNDHVYVASSGPCRPRTNKMAAPQLAPSVGASTNLSSAVPNGGNSNLQQSLYEQYNSRRHNETLLEELLNPSVNQALFAAQSKSAVVNNNFRIKLPFTKPVTPPTTTVTTATPVPLQSPSSASLQSQTTVPPNNSTAAEAPTNKVLNQGLHALSSIGQPSAMLNSSSRGPANVKNDKKRKSETNPVSKKRPAKRQKQAKASDSAETVEISSGEECSDIERADRNAAEPTQGQPENIGEALAADVEEPVIDLTWIDDMDEQELQSEMDFVFVKQENENDAAEETNSRVVPSPVDSGIASPPIQNEEDIRCTVVNLCICGQIAHYYCACGNALYCGQECQMTDWEWHQKTCQTVQRTNIEP